MRILGWAALAAFVGTVWLANWLVAKYGPVPVGFGLEAPAGVYAVGLAFTLRDIVHRTLGRTAVIAAVLAGCALAYWVGAAATVPGGYVSIAVASALAFLISETLDLLTYESVQNMSFTGAVVASNVVGAVIDSLLFLTLAFGSLAFLSGQIVGKLWMTVAVLPLVLLGRRHIWKAA